MIQTRLIVLLLGCSLATALAQTNALKLPPIADGPFKPDWGSLTNYQAAPEWYRDAKFGIWAHWGPQCQPEHGDWYARAMYEEGGWQYKLHVAQSKDGKVTVKSLASGSQQWPGKIGSVRLVGGGKLKFTRDASGLHVLLPEKFNGKIAFALKVRS